MYDNIKYFSLIQNLSIIVFSSVPLNKYKIAFVISTKIVTFVE